MPDICVTEGCGHPMAEHTHEGFYCPTCGAWC